MWAIGRIPRPIRPSGIFYHAPDLKWCRVGLMAPQRDERRKPNPIRPLIDAHDPFNDPADLSDPFRSAFDDPADLSDWGSDLGGDAAGGDGGGE